MEGREREREREREVLKGIAFQTNNIDSQLDATITVY